MVRDSQAILDGAKSKQKPTGSKDTDKAESSEGTGSADFTSARQYCSFPQQMWSQLKGQSFD